MAHLAPTCPSKWFWRNMKLRRGGHRPGGPLQGWIALEEDAAGRPLPFPPPKAWHDPAPMREPADHVYEA